MKNIKLLSLLLVVFFLSVTFVSCKKPVAVVTTTPPATTPSNDIKVTPPSEVVPNYEIIKKTDQLRTDKGVTGYIIIRPVDLSTDAFVSQIKNLVKKMVKEDLKQEKITIEIFDSMNALDMYVKDSNSKAPLLVTHYVAKYVGDSSDEIYKNTLYIFPNSTKEDKSEASQYFDIIDFDPANW
jgi:hypothetical protein